MRGWGKLSKIKMILGVKPKNKTNMEDPLIIMTYLGDAYNVMKGLSNKDRVKFMNFSISYNKSDGFRYAFYMRSNNDAPISFGEKKVKSLVTKMREQKYVD